MHMRILWIRWEKLFYITQKSIWSFSNFTSKTTDPTKKTDFCCIEFYKKYMYILVSIFVEKVLLFKLIANRSFNPLKTHYSDFNDGLKKQLSRNFYPAFLYLTFTGSQIQFAIQLTNTSLQHSVHIKSNAYKPVNLFHIILWSFPQNTNSCNMLKLLFNCNMKIMQYAETKKRSTFCDEMNCCDVLEYIAPPKMFIVRLVRLSHPVPFPG